MKIDLGNGKSTIIDDADWTKKRSHCNRRGVCVEYAPCEIKWYATKTGYARGGGGDNPRVFLHRLLTQCPAGLNVDHINGDRLDNRQSNLRLCGHQQNSRNRKKHSGHRCVYKGVGFMASTTRKYIKPYKARIVVNRKKIHIGYYRTQLEASLAYDDRAIKVFGEFAMLNFPERHGMNRARPASSQSQNDMPKRHGSLAV